MTHGVDTSVDAVGGVAVPAPVQPLALRTWLLRLCNALSEMSTTAGWGPALCWAAESIGCTCCAVRYRQGNTTSAPGRIPPREYIRRGGASPEHTASRSRAAPRSGSRIAGRGAFWCTFPHPPVPRAAQPVGVAVVHLQHPCVYLHYTCATCHSRGGSATRNRAIQLGRLHVPTIDPTLPFVGCLLLLCNRVGVHY